MSYWDVDHIDGRPKESSDVKGFGPVCPVAQVLLVSPDKLPSYIIVYFVRLKVSFLLSLYLLTFYLLFSEGVFFPTLFPCFLSFLLSFSIPFYFSTSSWLSTSSFFTFYSLVLFYTHFTSLYTLSIYLCLFSFYSFCFRYLLSSFYSFRKKFFLSCFLVPFFEFFNVLMYINFSLYTLVSTLPFPVFLSLVSLIYFLVVLIHRKTLRPQDLKWKIHVK